MDRPHLDWTSGARDGGALSNNTIARIGAVVRLALAEAEKRRLVRTNVANGATVPGREEVDGGIAYWTEEELGRFWNLIGTDHALFPLLYTAAWSGCRRGELLALRWADVDLAQGSAWIRVARKAVNGRVVEGPPKTARGVRQVPFLNSSLASVLASWRQRQVPSVQGYVFTDSLGQPLDPGAVTKRFRALVLGAVEDLGLPYITLHGLRHSFATTVLGWGVEPFKVSRILGHANISITLDLYNEYLPSRDDELRGMFTDQHLAL